MADQDTDIPSEAEKLDEEIEEESTRLPAGQGIKNRESSKKDGEVEGAKVDAESQLSEAGKGSSENTNTKESKARGDEATQAKAGDAEEGSRASTAAGLLAERGRTRDTEAAGPAESEQNEDESVRAKETTAEPESTDNPNAKWYVVHTYAGHENKVATGLKQRIESEHLEDKILDLLVPTQDKIEIRAGKKETVKEKIFPGYILIKMVLDDGSWLAVRTTPGVTSFVGMGNKPTPISDTEVKSIVQYMKQGAPATFKDVFLPDDTVKIIDGPFADFIGKVDTVDKEKGKVRVLVSIFGRETPVELDFLQVQKL